MAMTKLEQLKRDLKELVHGLIAAKQTLRDARERVTALEDAYNEKIAQIRIEENKL